MQKIGRKLAHDTIPGPQTLQLPPAYDVVWLCSAVGGRGYCFTMFKSIFTSFTQQPLTSAFNYDE